MLCGFWGLVISFFPVLSGHTFWVPSHHIRAQKLPHSDKARDTQRGHRSVCWWAGQLGPRPTASVSHQACE